VKHWRAGSPGHRGASDVARRIHETAVLSARFLRRLRNGGRRRRRLPLLDSGRRGHRGGGGEDCRPPASARRLDRYARYYAGTTDNGRRFIQGKLVPIGGNDTPGIHVVEGRMFPLQGEGCITYSESGGSGLSIKCARPGAWTPSDRQIAELEGLLQLPERHYVLQDYARYYAGVREGDRRIVIGVFLVPVYGAYWTTGIHVVSDVYFPIALFDAGCALVNVRYDPSSKEIGSRCSESFGGTKF
jgi:hypothetical protein